MPSFGSSVAVVGIGGIFPGAADLASFWENIASCRNSFREVPDGRWLVSAASAFDSEPGKPDKVYSTRGSFLDPLPPASALPGLSIDPAVLDGLDPLYHLLVHAGKRAFDDGATAALDRSRIGVIVGNLALPSETSTHLTQNLLGRTFEERLTGAASPPLPSSPLNRYVAGLPAGILARALGLGGGACTLDAACASSLYAIKLAMDELLSGRADTMLTGGVSRPDPLFTQMGFSQLRALSKRGICSPFDAAGDGLVVGEGAGIFLLKRVEDAVAHGDRIYGIIRGVGLANDVGGSLLAPMSEGQLRAMRAVYERVGWLPEDVDLIECHATGTPVGDAVEISSLKQLWGDAGRADAKCVIGSVKSNIGHLLTAAGGAALTKVLLAMRHETLPPTAGFTSAQPAMELDNSPFQVLQSPLHWRRRGDGIPRRAAVSAFGFGGINAHLLVEEWLPESFESMPSACEVKPVRKASSNAVAVVGIGASFGSWQTTDAVRERMLGGDCSMIPAPPKGWWGADECSWYRADGLDKTPFTGYWLEDAVLESGRFRIPPREMEEMLPQQLLMLGTAAEAIEDAGLASGDNPKAGVFVGIALDLNSTNFSLRWSMQTKAERWSQHLCPGISPEEKAVWMANLRDAASPPLTANRTMGALGSVVASRIAREFRIGGPSFTVSSEDNSGVRALEIAIRQLQNGELDQAVVGAVDLAGDLRAVLGRHSRDTYSPSGNCTPFDVSADGSIIGEGACAVVLKRLEDAEASGDRIYAVIKGVGTSSDGRYVQALQRAYDDAGVPPESVSYLEAAASGDPREDLGEITALSDFFFSGDHHPRSCAVSSVKGDIGHSGAAAGLASFVRACLALHHEIIPGCRGIENPCNAFKDVSPLFPPKSPRYWLRNRADGPRRAGVSSAGVDGSCSHLVLEGWDDAQPENLAPGGIGSEHLFVVAADSTDGIAAELDLLEKRLTGSLHDSSTAAIQRYSERSACSRAMSLITRDRDELIALIALGRHTLASGGTIPDTTPALRDRLFYQAEPLGHEGRIAFVFPGSGNHYPGMGMNLFSRWPTILHRQDGENLHLRRQFQPEKFWNGASVAEVNDDHRAVIFGQVATGCAVSDLVQSFGIRPEAIIGYSLGESAGLFASRAWRDRDLMYSRMQQSTLFNHDLAGECRAAGTAWGLSGDESVKWCLGVADAPEDAVRALLPSYCRAYLLIVNTPDECVIGGDADTVAALVARLGCRFFPLQGVTTVHCEVAAPVAQPYHDLHLFPTDPPNGITYYSGVKGCSYDVTCESAAASILGQALHGINYPAVIESAYRDGVRLFLEMGPGASCSRMIRRILGDRPHFARSACYTGQDAVSTMLRFLGALVAERVPVDLTPLLCSIGNVTVKSANSPTLPIVTGGRPFTPPLPPTPHSARLSAAPQPSAETARASDAALPSIGNSVELLQEFARTQLAQTEAHAAFLSMSETLSNSMAQALALEMSLKQALGSDVPAAASNIFQAVSRQGSLYEKSTINSFDFPPPFQGEGRGGDGVGVKSPASYDHQPHPHPNLPPEGEGIISKQMAQIIPAGVKAAFDRDLCMEFAIGSVARMLGPDFAEADSFPTRVRLPDEPLMLVDRIISIEGQPRSMTNGRVVTEHDILPGAWYLDGGRIPTCIAVESGQADLFLSGYLGIDFITRGLAVYRLLDAVVTFHRGLPGTGETIRYDISIERFFRQGDTWLFRFFFEASVGGEPLLSMREGCAGFFSQQELDAGKGIVRPAIDLRQTVGIRPDDWRDLVPMRREGYDAGQLDLLRNGDLAGCFGPLFSGLPLTAPLTIPGDRMRLVHRVIEIDPGGGRCGIGIITAEADIKPDDWFITCHFVDDRVMPGTLMYECCMHTLRIYLLRLGWVAESVGSVWEPVPGVASRLCCRGQVLETTKVVTYEVTIREIGYRPEPYVICDALMYADGKPIVEITAMSARLTGTTRQQLEQMWDNVGAPLAAPSCHAPDQDHGCGKQHPYKSGNTQKPALYTKEQILAYSNGNPSEGFGEPYRIFDHERKIARLPGPPFQFMDRVTAVRGEPFRMAAGSMAEAQYDLPTDAWFFAADRQARMPFSVLLEAALQPCGWLAAYAGSALTSPVDISFRNLGGTAIQHRPVTPESGTLTCAATMKKVATSGGMIIQEFDFTVADRRGILYEGETMFGFFTREALANQVGIRDAKPYQPAAAESERGRTLPYPDKAPFPVKQLRMIDRIDLFIPDGGPAGLGYVRGTKEVVADEWFFKAHFYEDPVTPGSLGLESFLQLVKFAAVERWGWQPGDILEASAIGRKHKWLYRGQVVPSNDLVTVSAWITAVDEQQRILTADGYLSVDGKLIYQMNDFTVKICRNEL